MTSTTSLKLPDELKAQIAIVAKQEGKSAHALMVEALQTAMNEASLLQAFRQSALAAYEETVRLNKVYRGEDIKAYYLAKIKGEKIKKPDMVTWQPDSTGLPAHTSRSRKHA